MRGEGVRLHAELVELAQPQEQQFPCLATGQGERGAVGHLLAPFGQVLTELVVYRLALARSSAGKMLRNVYPADLRLVRGGPGQFFQQA